MNLGSSIYKPCLCIVSFLCKYNFFWLYRSVFPVFTLNISELTLHQTILQFYIWIYIYDTVFKLRLSYLDRHMTENRISLKSIYNGDVSNLNKSVFANCRFLKLQEFFSEFFIRWHCIVYKIRAMICLTIYLMFTLHNDQMQFDICRLLR